MNDVTFFTTLICVSALAGEAQAQTADGAVTPVPQVACGAPGHEATCVRVSRLQRVAVAAASSGSCDGLAVAEHACVTLLRSVDDLCRLVPASVNAAGRAAGDTPETSDGAIFNRVNPVRLHPEILNSVRFCSSLLAVAARSRGTEAPPRAMSCGDEPEASPDALGVVENGIASLSFGLALERAQNALHACVVGGITRSAVASSREVTGTGGVHGEGTPLSPFPPSSSRSPAEPEAAPLGWRGIGGIAAAALGLCAAGWGTYALISASDLAAQSRETADPREATFLRTRSEWLELNGSYTVAVGAGLTLLGAAFFTWERLDRPRAPRVNAVGLQAREGGYAIQIAGSF